MQPNIFSPDILRADYNRVKQIMAKFNPGTPFLITLANLRIEQVLAAGKNQYTFNLYEVIDSQRPLEIKLNRNDLFIPGYVGLTLAKYDSTVTGGNGGNYLLKTFPDPNYFVGTDGSGNEEHVALNCVYNGKMTVKTDPVVRMRNLATSEFLYIPEKQEFITGTLSDQLKNEPAQFGPTPEQRGYFRLQPQPIFNGNENNSVQVDLGEGDTTLIAGGFDSGASPVDTRNVLVFNALGYIVVNGAQSLGRWTSQNREQANV